MHPALLPFAARLPRTGNLAADIDDALRLSGRERTREHVPRVARLAHKIEWGQGGAPPYRTGLLAVLETGLEARTRFMLVWMWAHCAELLVALPELREAGAAFEVGENRLP